MKTANVGFDTYPPLMSDYDHHIENDDYDNQYRWFTVPRKWAEEFVQEVFHMSLAEFEDTYTWDDTDWMYNQALLEFEVVSDEILQR